MSEAKSAQRSEPPATTVARALLALFEEVVANARDRGDNVERLGDWADEFKPALEQVLRGKFASTPKFPKE